MKKTDTYADRVAALGCLISGGPAQLHHCKGGSMRDHGVHKGMSQKTADELIIPLAERFHTGADGIHTIGVLTWEDRYGTQIEMLAKVAAIVGPAPMPEKPMRRRPKSLKVLPRRIAQ